MIRNIDSWGPSALMRCAAVTSLGGVLACAQATVPSGVVAPQAYDDADPSALDAFQTALRGHGTWALDSTYGTVWVPSSAEVGKDFVPYATGGHWGYDPADDGWAWCSVYDWGWGPFHYGRWFLGELGWSWVPGRTFAPAWVDWKVESGSIGWAPSPPTFAWHHNVAEPIARAERPATHFVYVAPSEVYDAAARTHDDQGLVRARSFAHLMIAAGEHPVTPRDEVPAARTDVPSVKGAAHGSRRAGSDRGRSERGARGRR